MIDHPLASLDAWAAYFAEADIPVLRHTLQSLESKRENAANVNGRVLSGIILHDPLLTLRVLAYIQSHRKQRQITDITTIERAIMMIGVDPFFRDFQNLPLVEDRLAEHPQALLGLLKVINRSRRAAHWAREWAVMRHDVDIDEITVATLLHDVPEILMWCFAPALALQYRNVQMAHRDRRSAQIQTEVYGLPLQLLKRELAKAWNLPQLLTTLIDDENESNPRVRNVKLAVDLARHSANGWDDAAIPDDLRGICELLHINQRTLVTRLGLDEATTSNLLEIADAADAENRMRGSG